MSWVTVGIAAAGAIKGMMDAKASQRKAESHDKFRKAAIEMSPWTGMGDPGAAAVGNTSMASGALGGGLQGAMIGSLFGGGGAAAGAGEPAAALTPKSTAALAMNTRPSQMGPNANPWMMS